MTRNRFLLLTSLCAGLALTGTALGQSTKVIPINGGPGFSGTLDGMITATVKASGGGETTGAFLDVTDLDIQTVNGGGFLNFFPDSTSNNNTAFTTINIAPSVIGIDLNPTNFSSPVTGSATVTAGDSIANGIIGAVDGGLPGPDGAWDDPLDTGLLNNATADAFGITLNNPISATANVSGGINASLPSDVTIPNVVDTTVIDADLRIKNSSNVSVNFSPIQNVSLSNLSISNSVPFDLNLPSSGNFSDGNHPTPGATGMLNLSTRGSDLVSTTISGNLIADIMGTITGSIDIAADIEIIGFIDFTVDEDNVIDGLLSEGTVSLIDLNETVTLPDTDLPFQLTVIHNASGDVDFDDIVAQLLSGTLGLELPISLLEEDVVLDLPETSFELFNLVTEVDAGAGQSGEVRINHLAATLGGTLVLDIAADLTLAADLNASGTLAGAINVVPEPSSMILLALAGIGLAAVGYRRRGRK